MAATGTATEEQVLPQVPLRILVDREKNRVLFAEAGKDFVDVLISFLTLPLGTISRLVGKESNMQPVRVGCLTSLYGSVENLDEEHLWTETCKAMLLQPRNSMEAYCQELKLNIDDTEPTKYFICENWGCSRKESGGLLSTFRNVRCLCGKLMNREISPQSSNFENGYVQETSTFIICDDLTVIPNVFGTSIVLLQNLGIEDMDAIEELKVNVTEKEIMDLLKCSLLSKTPLTDLFLKKKQFLENLNLRNESKFSIGEVPENEGRQMVVKVLLRKSNRKILFAQAEEDFADFIFNFLTFPLGGVLHMLEGCSSLSCIDKLYNSVGELNAQRYLRSQELKNMLANPQCSSKFKLNNQILPIGEASHVKYICSSYLKESWKGYLSTNYVYQENYSHVQAPLDYVDPSSSAGETSSLRGFCKGPSMYMVTDDLVVTPMSSISGFSFLGESKIPLCDLEEKIITVGMKEGLSILKAALISTSALTNGLYQFIESIKKEF